MAKPGTDDGSHLLHHFKVEAEQLFETRPLNLEHHLASTSKARPVHLSQRCGCNGLRIYLQIIETITERTPNKRLQRIPVQGFSLVR